jgi:hypothetical protein
MYISAQTHLKGMAMLLKDTLYADIIYDDNLV